MKTTFQLADLFIEIEAEGLPELLRTKARVDELRRDVALLCHMWQVDESKVSITHRNVSDEYDYYDAVLTVHPFAKISFGTHKKPDDPRFPFFPGGASRYFNPWAIREGDNDPETGEVPDYGKITTQLAGAVYHGKKDEWDCYTFARSWPHERFKALADRMKEAVQQRREAKREAA